MSMMSAPSITICSACATAASGERKAPPSENESGVMFNIPITTGRRSASRSERASAFAADGVPVWESGGDTAFMAPVCAVALVEASEAAPALQLSRNPTGSIRNHHRKSLGVVYPPFDRAFGGQHVHELSFCVRFCHRLR